MKTTDVLIAGAVVIGVVGVIYYLTSQPKSATTTNVYQAKKDNIYSVGSTLIDRLGDIGLRALNSGGGSSSASADTSGGSVNTNRYAGSLTGGGLTLDPMLM
jgi:hypothetical protein